MRKQRTENREPRTESREPIRFSILCFRLSVLCFLFSSPLLAQEIPASQCQMPRPIPRLVCPEAGEFLCVNTPPGSVKENFVLLKGRLYLDSSTLSALSVSVQNEYTREIRSIVLGEPLKENCWEQNLGSQNNFCLEAGGKFSVHVPLDELGPYTLLVAASRSEGSTQKTVRTSFVVRPTLTADAVAYETGATHAQVQIDLLKDCEGEACDFIGTTTGGVWVTVDNAIASPRGREVRCETNVVQGGAGQFTIGVPVQPGGNQLKVIVCNAATGFEKSRCPQIALPPVQVGGGLPAIEVLSVTPLRFKIANDRSEGCDDSVKVTVNLEDPKSVCPNPQGIYEVPLRAVEGYNIASIEADRSHQKIIKTIIFTKGRVLSPFDESGGRLSNAIRLSLARGMIEETLWPLFGDYLKSEKFGEMLRGWADEETQNENAEEREKNVGEFSYCPKTGGGENHLRIKVIQPPQIGKIELGPLEFRAQKLKTSLKAKDVSLSIQLYKDENNDRRPDIDPLPLKIAFEEIELEPVLEAGGSQETLLVKLTSPHTDCDYKRRGACFSMPALFTPKKFKGGANRAGAFATCDHSQAVSPRMEEICHALNVLDRQTGGVIQEKILDTLNRAYACSASAALTAMLRNGIPVQKTSPLFALEGRVGAETLQIGEEGLIASLFTQFGNPEIFEAWPQELQQAGVGILLTGAPAVSQRTFSEEGMGLELFMPLLSQMFWGLRSPGGEPFSIKIDEAFFRERGFDFDSRCAGGEADPLCNIRPRAQEILGSVVTDYGVVEPNDPLTLNLTPSLAFPLRLLVVNEEGKVRAELADWELGVSSQSGSLMKASLSLKLTLEVSQPTVSSDDPDHLRVEVKVVPAESRVWLTPIEETNRTVIPGTVFFSTLEETFQFAIDNFSQEGKEIVIPIERFVEFPEESFFAQLGLKELSWGPNGLGWEWQAPTNSVQLKAKFSLH